MLIAVLEELELFKVFQALKTSSIVEPSLITFQHQLLLFQFQAGDCKFLNFAVSNYFLYNLAPTIYVLYWTLLTWISKQVSHLVHTSKQQLKAWVPDCWRRNTALNPACFQIRRKVGMGKEAHTFWGQRIAAARLRFWFFSAQVPSQASKHTLLV